MPVVLPKERHVTGLVQEPIVEVKGFSVLGGENYQICHEAGGSPIAIGEGVNSKNFCMHCDSKLMGGPVGRVPPSKIQCVEAAFNVCGNQLRSYPEVYLITAKDPRPRPYFPIERLVKIADKTTGQDRINR